MLSKRDPQGLGSALTYSKRQALMAVVGVVADEDDDGNAGSGGTAPRRTAPPVSQAPSTNGSRLLTDEQRERVIAAVGADARPDDLFLSSVGVTSFEERPYRPPITWGAEANGGVSVSIASAMVATIAW